MIIPKNETRKIKPGKLDNKIKYCSILDKNLNKSHFTLRVNVGQIHGPKEFPGLPHFLEHMLFLGSEKYPDSNYFRKFISKNGGITNAFTIPLGTIYFFSIIDDKLEKAIDILSQFFKKPLFDENMIERELEAIQSEENRHINNDSRKMHRMLNIIALPDSQKSIYGSGNIKTLKKKGLLDTMKKFYKKYYQPENITISLVSSMDLNKQDKIIKKYFNNIKSNNLNSKSEIIKPFFSSDREIYYLKNNNENNMVFFIWEIPTYIYYKNSSCFDIIIKIFNKIGSLRNYLIDNNYISNLNFSFQKDGIVIIYFKLIDIKYWKIVESHLKYFFAKLNNLDWEKNLNVIKKEKEIKFKYGQNIPSSELGKNIVYNLKLYSFNKIYVGKYFTDIKNDIEKINELLNYYLDFNKVKILLISPNLIEKDKKFIIDEHYGFKYTKLNNEKNKVKKLPLSLQLVNKFNDFNPKVIKNLKFNKPINLEKNIWFGNTSNFEETFVYLSIFFTNPEFVNKDNNLKYMVLYNYLRIKLSRIFNLEHNINIFFNIIYNHKYNNFEIFIKCYNNYFTNFLKDILNALIKIKITKDDHKIINNIKTNIINTELNLKNLEPTKYIGYVLKKQTFPNFFSIEEKCKKLSKLDNNEIIKTLPEFLNLLFNKSQRTIYAYGNYHLNNFKKDIEIIKSYINTIDKPILQLKNIYSESVIQSNKNKREKAIGIYYPIGQFDPKSNALLKVLNTMTNSMFFNEIRTKKQYGYIANTSIDKISKINYYIQSVQTGKNLENLKKDIQQFDNDFIKKIDNKLFNNSKKSVKNNLKSKKLNIKYLFEKYKSEIIRRRYLFNKNELIIRELNKLSFKDFIRFYKYHILNQKPIIIIIK